MENESKKPSANPPAVGLTTSRNLVKSSNHPTNHLQNYPPNHLCKSNPIIPSFPINPSFLRKQESTIPSILSIHVKKRSLRSSWAVSTITRPRPAGSYPWPGPTTTPATTPAPPTPWPGPRPTPPPPRWPRGTGIDRCTRRRLTNYLFLLAAEGRISNGGVKTFRNIYDLSRRLTEAADPREAQRLCRQARNRVSALLRSLEGAIAGRPVTGRSRRSPRPPSRPLPQSMAEIMALPDYPEIAQAHDLAQSPLARLPDPHDFYARGLTPRPCPCHPADLSRRGDPSTIELSPLWKRALEKTFHVPFPNTIPVRC